MRIENLRKEKTDGLVRVAATLIWENANQKTRDVYFETLEEFGDDLHANPNAFLLGALWPAVYFGEKRIKIDGGVCPLLKDGLRTNMEWYRLWYGKQYKAVDIEAPARHTAFTSKTPKGVGLFLSNGIDSLYTLRMNRLQFPIGHEAAIRDGILVHGFEMYYDEKVDRKLENFKRALQAASEVAQDAKVSLIPVYTNVRHLNSELNFWMEWFFGAAMAAVAHALVSRFKAIWISSDGDVSEVRPWGAHPALAENYGSFDLTVCLSQLRTRLEKTKLLCEWDTALKNLRVCTHNPKGLINCGKCEKCVRTMLMLLVLDKLDKTDAFPVKDVDPDQLWVVHLEEGRHDHKAKYYKDILEPLRRMGRSDLARMLEKELGWTGDIKRFDRKHLRSSLINTYGATKRLFVGGKK